MLNCNNGIDKLALLVPFQEKLHPYLLWPPMLWVIDFPKHDHAMFDKWRGGIIDVSKEVTWIKYVHVLMGWELFTCHEEESLAITNLVLYYCCNLQTQRIVHALGMEGCLLKQVGKTQLYIRMWPTFSKGKGKTHSGGTKSWGTRRKSDLSYTYKRTTRLWNHLW